MSTGRAFHGWYGHFFFHELIPIYPLYGIMFVERGLTPFQLSLLFTTWSIAALAAEVPTGALADVVSRKLLLAVSSLTKAATYLVWMLAPTFWGFWAGFILWGISGALRSGTAEALLHDTLLETGRTGDFTRVYGRIRAASTAAIGIAMLAGSRIVRYGYTPVLLTSIASLLVASAVALLFMSETRRRGTVRRESYIENLRAGVREAVRNPRARYLVLLSAAVLPLGGSFDEFVGPILKQSGFTREAAAALFAGIYLVQIGGMLMAYRMQHVRTSAPLAAFAMGGVLLLLTAFGRGWAAPLGMTAFFGLFALGATLFAGKLQDAIEGDARATVTSVSNAALHGGGMAIFLAFGLLSSETDLRPGVSYVAVTAVGFAGVFALLAHRWRVR